MSELTEADAVWNRATVLSTGDDPQLGPGDRALAALLLAHGLAMNGGVQHCLESLSEAQLRNAKAGFRYFGLEDVANLLVDGRHRLSQAADSTLEQQEQLEGELDDAYWKLVPSDQRLRDVFEEGLRTRRSDFAPL